MKNLQEWSAQVKARDGKCMECGEINDLHAHHIKHKSTNPELKLDLANGKTLCYRCHKAEHERKRPPRIRSNRPQRKSMERLIVHLQADNARLTACNIAMERLLAMLDKVYITDARFVKAYNDFYRKG